MIYVECKPDRVLVEFLVRLPKRQIVHELKGKYEVCIRVSRQENCKAVIDEDPDGAQPRYLNGLPTLDDRPELKRLLHASRNNHVILLRPRLEEWLIATARSAGIRISSAPYRLPDDGVALHDVITRNPSKLDPLLRDLAQAPAMQALRQMLTL